MTLRELRGWTPRSVTVGADGEVLSVTVSESRFSAGEVARLLASRRRERVVRGAHGIPLVEAMDPANQFAFETTPPVMDWAQKALNVAQEAYRKQNPKSDMSAVHIRVRKKA